MNRVLLVLLACLGLAACGSSEEPAAEVRPVPSTSTATPTAPPERPEPSAPPAASGATGPTEAAPAEEDANPGGASADGEANPGGAGDEEPIRQPARFEVGSVSVTPVSVTVAPFLPVELAVVSVDEGFHEVKLIGTDVAFTLQGGQTETRMLPGLKAGVYTLAIDGGEDSASLVVGDEAGP